MIWDNWAMGQWDNGKMGHGTMGLPLPPHFTAGDKGHGK